MPRKAAPVAALAKNRRAPKPVRKRPLSERAAPLRAWLTRRLVRVRRLAPPLLRVALAAAVLAGVVSVARLLEHYMHTSRSFAIAGIEVHGQQHLTREQVIAGAGLSIGQNVFVITGDEARQRLLKMPWIESARVRCHLPGSFEIEVRERRAVALLALDELYLVSDDGVAFKPLGEGDPYDLPVITGIDPTQVAQDKRASASALMSAVALLHDYQDAGLSKREAISEIHIESDGSLSLYVGTDATHVRLGRAPFRQKLERFSEVMGLLASQQTRAAYVLLDNQRRVDRVTVRLR